MTTDNRSGAYQVENASGDGLVFSTLGQEKQTLASLGCPGSGVLSNRRALLRHKVGCQVLGINSIVGKVEESFGETEAPGS